MPKVPQGQKSQPDIEKQKQLLREAEAKQRSSVLEMIEHFKEPKYPASTITERQKARNDKYRKAYRAILASIDRRIAKREGRGA
jgi:hypothetical protein